MNVMTLMTPRRLATFAVLPLLLMACNPGSLVGPSSTPVAVLFQGASAGTGTVATAQTGDATLIVTGTNGTLEITSIEAVVSELELECESGSTVACVEFETGPSFAPIPLGATQVEIAGGSVPAGTYTEFEFEIDDLEPDHDDSEAERQAKEALLAEIRETYGDPPFPATASMILQGSFTPAGSDTAAPFTAFVDGEVEIEVPLVPALEVVEGADPLAIPVTVDPSLWLTRPDGTVYDLSQYDYATTGAMPSFEIEIEGAFVAEYDEDDDGYDDDRDDGDHDDSSEDASDD